MSPPRAAVRLRRTLALLPYIAAHPDVTVGELAEAFGVTEDAMRADLEVLPYCGLPPYTPDRLINLVISGDVVNVSFAEYFTRPLRLTPAEGFALLAAGRALLAVPGSESEGPLATALDKLEAALGAQEVLDVNLSEPDHLPALRAATERSERIEIDYYSFGRDAVTTRTVDPFTVVATRGHWYVAAHCHQAQGERLFRVDRIRALTLTGETFERREAPTPPDDLFHASPDDVRVTLDLPASAAWVGESFPAESVEERKGRVAVTLAVSALPLLERILLMAGSEARVVEPADWAGVGPAAAERVLRLYDEDRQRDEDRPN